MKGKPIKFIYRYYRLKYCRFGIAVKLGEVVNGTRCPGRRTPTRGGKTYGAGLDVIIRGGIIGTPPIESSG